MDPIIDKHSLVWLAVGDRLLTEAACAGLRDMRGLRLLDYPAALWRAASALPWLHGDAVTFCSSRTQLPST